MKQKLCIAWAILMTAIVLHSCTSRAMLIDSRGERLSLVVAPVLKPDPRYAEDIVFMPAGTAISYDNLIMVTKHDGYYFSKRYQAFSVDELLRLFSGEKLEMTADARQKRWQDFIKKDK